MSAFLLDFLNFLDSIFFAFLKFLDSIFFDFLNLLDLNFLNFLDSIFLECFFGFWCFFLIFWFFWILTFLNFLKFELPFSRTRIFRNSPLFKINWLKVGSVLGPLRGIYIQVFPSPLLGLSFIQKSGWRVFYLLNGMCLSQPSSLYQRCFLFPLLKGPGFPTVFLENFPIFEGFLKAKCFPTLKVRAQGCQNKIK